MDKRSRIQIKRTNPEYCQKDQEDKSLEEFEQDKATNTRTEDELYEVQALKKQMADMMSMMAAMAKGKGSIESEEGSIKNLNESTDNQNPTSRQGNINKYDQSNPFVIRVNKPLGGTSESSSRKVEIGLKEAQKTSSVKVDVPMRYTELLPVLIERNLIVPVHSFPKEPPYPKSYNSRATCGYHLGSSGHTTENCGALKNRVRDLVIMGALTFEGGRPIFSNEPVITQGIKSKNNQNPGHGVDESESNLEAEEGGTPEEERASEHLRQEKEELNEKLKNLQDEYQKLHCVFQNTGLGNTFEEWNKGILQLKNDLWHWKQRGRTSENRARSLSQRLKEAESQRDVLKNELESNLDMNEVWKSSLQQSEGELRTVQTENTMLKEHIKELRTSLRTSEISAEAYKQAGYESVKKVTLQLQKAEREIQEKDKDIENIITEARKIAQQVADVADTAMPLSQNMNPALDHEGKMARLLKEVQKLGARAHQYL